MSMIVKTYKGGMCGICWNDFTPGEEQLTHVGGERHDGFHRECLRDWVILKPSCPFDREPIDSHCLITKTEQIMNRIRRPALVEAVYTAGVAAAALAGAIVTGARGIEAGGVAGVVVAGTVYTAGVIVAGAAIAGIENGIPISVGICVGTNVIFLSGTLSLAVLATGSLAAGVTAGIFSLMR